MMDIERGVARVNSIYPTANISARLNMYRSGGNGEHKISNTSLVWTTSGLSMGYSTYIA